MAAWYDRAVFYHIYPLGFADVKRRMIISLMKVSFRSLLSGLSILPIWDVRQFISTVI